MEITANIRSFQEDLKIAGLDCQRSRESNAVKNGTNVDIILNGLNMPGMDVIELAKKVARKNHLIKVISWVAKI